MSLPGHTALRLALERARAPKDAPAPAAAPAAATASAPVAPPRPAPTPRPPPPAPSAQANPAPRQARRSSAPKPRRASVRITDLQDLAAVARHLHEEKSRREAEEKAQREAAARRESERHLFSHAVGPITRLRERNLALPRRPLPPPLPVQHQLDEQRALQESISDDFDVSTLLDTDDQLSFRRPGIGVEVTQRLRAGHWSIQRQLDLHGLRVDEARLALGEFIRTAHKNGVRCVRVVHGKGLGSPGKSPVLKSRVQRWLVQKHEVLAFVQARPVDGGAGAMLVLLQPVGLRQR